MTRKAFMVGTGGHARMMRAVLLESGRSDVEIVGWLETPDYQGDATLDGLPVWPQTEEGFRQARAAGCDAFYFGVGSVRSVPGRWQAFSALCREGFAPLTLIHPAAIISSQAGIGEGCYIGAAAVVQPFAKIGDACIVNTGGIVEHDVTIGQNVHVGPGSVLCGTVTVGEHSIIGGGSVVIQHVTIGREATIGAGSTVIRDVPDRMTVVGKPATVLAGA